MTHMSWPAPAHQPSLLVVNRRHALLGVVGAGLALAAPSAADNPSPFRHSVASGDPLPHAVILWTRVTPQSRLRWEMSSVADFSTISASGTARTSEDSDFTVHIDATGLAPATTYHYRFTVLDGPHAGAVSPTGRTRTAPAAGATVDSLTFALASCANWESGYFAAYADIARRGFGGHLDAVIFLGDYIYEYARGEYTGKHGAVRDHDPPWETRTLNDYRTRYARYRTDTDLQAAHASAPWIMVWDDHESANNSWRDGARNHTEGAEGTWTDRATAARRAWLEWMPVRASGCGIHRSFDFGALAHLAIMDLRSYRDDALNHMQWLSGVPAEHTMLGDAQYSWLADDLRSATARWTILGNSVMLAPMNLTTLWQHEQLGPVADFLGARHADGIPLNLDQWDGFGADRTRLLSLLRALQEAGGTETLVLTGDIHSEWAHYLNLDDVPLGLEVVCSSINAPNVDDQLNLPEDNALSLLAETVMRNANHHIEHVDLDAHGYTIVHITDDAADVMWLRVADPRGSTSAVSEFHRMRWVIGQGFV
jgi:Phosphodiesterase/alkaline phosphatase D